MLVTQVDIAPVLVSLLLCFRNKYTLLCSRTENTPMIAGLGKVSSEVMRAKNDSYGFNMRCCPGSKAQISTQHSSYNNLKAEAVQQISLGLLICAGASLPSHPRALMPEVECYLTYGAKVLNLCTVGH